MLMQRYKIIGDELCPYLQRGVIHSVRCYDHLSGYIDGGDPGSRFRRVQRVRRNTSDTQGIASRNVSWPVLLIAPADFAIGLPVART